VGLEKGGLSAKREQLSYAQQALAQELQAESGKKMIH
jgi:hypothetical protein